MTENIAKGFNQLYRSIKFYYNNKLIGEVLGETVIVPEKDDVIVIAKKHYRVSYRQVLHKQNTLIREPTNQLTQSKCIFVHLTRISNSDAASLHF